MESTGSLKFIQRFGTILVHGAAFLLGGAFFAPVPKLGLALVAYAAALYLVGGFFLAYAHQDPSLD